MNQPPPPLDILLDRLRSALGDFSPELLSERLEPVVEGFFEQFQLVQRREYDAHMATLVRLERTVADLETRIASLEQQGGA